jgi:hypothetical protein
MFATLGSAPEAPVRSQTGRHREGLEAGGRERASAALAHFFIVVEDIDHRTDGLFLGTSQIAICSTVRVDEANDIVTVTAGVAE